MQATDVDGAAPAPPSRRRRDGSTPHRPAAGGKDRPEDPMSDVRIRPGSSAQVVVTVLYHTNGKCI